MLPGWADSPSWRRALGWGGGAWGKHRSGEHSICSGFYPRTYNEMKKAGEGVDISFIAPDIALFSQKSSWELEAHALSVKT